MVLLIFLRDIFCVYVNSWEGSGVNEVGKDKASGSVRIRINPRYYRPTEVVCVPCLLFLLAYCDRCHCLSVCLSVTLRGHVGLVAWCSGNASDPISKVTVRRARLVLRWVTACGQVNHLGM